jgi:hypothetical protein
VAKRPARRMARTRRPRRSRRSVNRTSVRRRNTTPRNAAQRDNRERALFALRDMRRKGLSLPAAVERWGITLDIARRYVGSALRKVRGEWRPTPFDRIPRTLNFLTPEGPIVVTVRDSRTASLIGEYMNAVRTRSVPALARFRRRSFRAGGKVHRFVTDVDLLDRLDDAGLITIEGLYRSIHGGRS